jgi:hypothetical protein
MRPKVKLQVTQEKNHVPARKRTQFFRRPSRALFNSLSLSPIRKMWICLHSKQLRWAQPTLRGQRSLTYSRNSSPSGTVHYKYPKAPYNIQDTALLWARWIQSTSSCLPSLRHKTVRKVLSYLSYLINKIRKNYTQKRVEEGKDSQRQTLDIQFAILLRWTASIGYCRFYLFTLRSI